MRKSRSKSLRKKGGMSPATLERLEKLREKRKKTIRVRENSNNNGNLFLNLNNPFLRKEIRNTRKKNLEIPEEEIPEEEIPEIIGTPEEKEIGKKNLHLIFIWRCFQKR